MVTVSARKRGSVLSSVFDPLTSITKMHKKSIRLLKKDIVCANKIEGVKAAFPALAFKVHYADKTDLQ